MTRTEAARVRRRSASNEWVWMAVRWLLALAVMAVAGWVLARDLEWRAVKLALVKARYPWVLLALAAIVGTFFSRTWRWRVLLGSKSVGFWPTQTALLVGQAVNTGVPMLRSGDVTRALWINRLHGVPLSRALTSIALEKVWDLLALCATGLMLIIWVPLPEWFVQSTWGSLVMVGFGLTALYLLVRWRRGLRMLASWVTRWLPGQAGRWVLPRVDNLLSALASMRRPDVMIGVGAYTALTWSLGGMANWAVMRAFGVNSIDGAVFLLAALMLGSAVVPTPGRIGVFEGICVAGLTLFGVSADLGLAIGLVLHLVVLVPALLMAGVLALFSLRVGRSHGVPIPSADGDASGQPSVLPEVAEYHE